MILEIIIKCLGEQADLAVTYHALLWINENIF